MKNHQHRAKLGLLHLFAGACCWVGTHTADAASFQIFSGYSFVNPASLGFVDNYQVSLGMDTVLQDAEFEGSAEFISFPLPNGLVVPVSPIGSGTAVSDNNLYLPTGRIAKRLNNDWVIGVDIDTPFACNQNWGVESYLRFIGTKTELRTVNIAPNVAYQVDEDLFIGGGIDIQYLEANLNFAQPQGLIPLNGLGLNTPSANFTNGGSDWGLGWHVGMIYQPWQGGYFGLTYWSQVDHTLTGVSSFQYANPMTTEFSVSSTLPATMILDYIQYFSPEFLIKGSISRTDWSSVQELRLKNTAIANNVKAIGGNPDGDVVIGLNYSDSWRYSVGTRYEFNKTWAGMASLSYDTTPTSDDDFSARAPDGDITTAAVGVRYNMDEHKGIDLIYAYSFVHDNDLDHTDGFVRAVGTTSMQDHTISVLFTWKG